MEVMMTDEQYAELLRRIDATRSAAASKGHFFILLLLIVLVFFKG